MAKKDEPTAEIHPTEDLIRPYPLRDTPGAYLEARRHCEKCSGTGTLVARNYLGRCDQCHGKGWHVSYVRI